MNAAWSFPIPCRSHLYLLLPVIMLVVLAACRDGRVTGRNEGATVLPEAQEATQEAVSPTPRSSQEDRDMLVNRIAYVGSDGNIFTIKPDGTDSRRLTTTDVRVGLAGHVLAQVSEGEVIYAWPTWSPDSTKLAVSRVTVYGTSTSFSLEAVDASTGRSTRIYDNEPDTPPVAQGSPHYIYWSPDSRHLAFIASTPRELALFISTPGEDRVPSRLIGQGPLYFSWSDDSSVILIHRGPELLLASASGEAPQSPRSLGLASVGFRAPVLSHDGSKMVYVAEDGGEHSLYLADTLQRLSDAQSILDVGSLSAFLRSPTRDEIAVADTATGPFYEQLNLVSVDGTQQRPLVSEPLLAFFWSPDGEKIAYVNYDPAARSFTWKYVNRAGGTPVELVEFLPSGEFLTMISFFDQYANSNSIWSPDSSQIVFSGTIAPSSPRRNGASPDGDKAYVLDVREGAVPREIAASRFAVWSWK